MTKQDLFIMKFANSIDYPRHYTGGQVFPENLEYILDPSPTLHQIPFHPLHRRQQYNNPTRGTKSTFFFLSSLLYIYIYIKHPIPQEICVLKRHRLSYQKLVHQQYSSKSR
jgi:hypothetical protein